ncbi:hypothetical protein V6N13_099653 [Hibiscus sabdariffa]
MLRLHEWGLGEIKVQRMGGKSYLMSFEDDELFTMLADVNWSYLKEIFAEVFPWSENVSHGGRATWLELYGLPLHCWNHGTIKKVAELWGAFESLGENANHSKDCEKVYALIVTNEEKRIEGLVEIEAGNMVHVVRVSEIDFKDDSAISKVSKNCDVDAEKTKESLARNPHWSPSEAKLRRLGESELLGVESNKARGQHTDINLEGVKSGILRESEFV